MVVSHSGDDKITAQEKLNFTDVFIGDEYYECQEYLVLDEAIEVHFIPCPLARQYSSSALAVERSLQNAAKLKVIKDGTAGLVYVVEDKPLSIVIKTIRVSQLETVGTKTANVYGVPIPPPRNFKSYGADHKFPNLPGVNAYREIYAQEMIMSYEWCPITNCRNVYKATGDTSVSVVRDDWSHMNTDKADAKEIYFVHQRFAGMSVNDWVEEHQQDQDFTLKLISIVRMTRSIINDLKNIGLVHGDVHADNLCVTPVREQKNQPVIPEDHQNGVGDDAIHISLVDWGWCLHRSFVMDEEERTYYENCLNKDWDWFHFLASLKYMYHDRPWFEDFCVRVEYENLASSYDFDFDLFQK
jgi:hypothetical protein